MEGVGARLGRSSTRYGPPTVFTGPVRKWKKRWIPYTPPNNSSNGANHNNHHHSSVTNGAANGNSVSHLLLYKWAPLTPSQNGNNGNGNGNGNGKNHVENNTDESTKDVVGGDEEEQQPQKRKFKYIPVAVLEEQKNEMSEQGEDEAKPMETETDGTEPTSKSDGFDGKPDINDTPADESQNQVQENDPMERQDLNESTLDLSLGLKAHDGEDETDSKTNQKNDG